MLLRALCVYGKLFDFAASPSDCVAALGYKVHPAVIAFTWHQAIHDMTHACEQGTLWDLVASSVPWDVQPPAEGKLSAHETLAKTVMLLLLASPGIPTLPQDVTEDARHLSTLAQCLAFRRAYAAHLTPPSFDPERAVQWHGATPGAALPKAHGNSAFSIAELRQVPVWAGKVAQGYMWVVLLCEFALPACV